jgi:hypothetical protein
MVPEDDILIYVIDDSLMKGMIMTHGHLLLFNTNSGGHMGLNLNQWCLLLSNLYRPHRPL